MSSNVIVWDLETVLDLRGYAATNGMGAATDDEIREAIGDKFPKQIYHSIVCIGALVVHREHGVWVVDALGAPHVGDRTEKQLITAFVDRIDELSPQLVTFNGNSFDLPVLRYRAMINKVAAPGLSARPYFREGKIQEIADYCETDVLNTYRVWLRFELFRGRLGPDDFEASEKALAAFFKAKEDTKPHLSGMAG
jgi:predicted PolB exonuclease-like 3'-5' exonuclease